MAYLPSINNLDGGSGDQTELSIAGIEFPLYSEQWMDQKVFRLPKEFDLDPSTCVFASNGLSKQQHVFIYAGDVKTNNGQILEQTPLAHLNLSANGGTDWVGLDPVYGIRACIMEPYAHSNASNKTEYKEGASCLPIEVTTTDGVFNVTCRGNTPSIARSVQIKDVKQDTFVFNIKGLAPGYILDIILTLNGSQIQRQSIRHTTKRYEILIPLVYTAVLVQNVSLNFKNTSSSAGTPKWVALSSTIQVLPGRVVSVALKDNNATQTQLKTWDALKLLSINQPIQGGDSTSQNSLD